MTEQADEQFRGRLAKVLRAALAKRNLTVYAMARMCGLAEQTARNIVDGRAIPRLDTVISIETGLGMEFGDLSRGIRDLMVEEVRRELAEMDAAAKAEAKMKKKK